MKTRRSSWTLSDNGDSDEDDDDGGDDDRDDDDDDAYSEGDELTPYPPGWGRRPSTYRGSDTCDSALMEDERAETLEDEADAAAAATARAIAGLVPAEYEDAGGCAEGDWTVAEFDAADGEGTAGGGPAVAAAGLSAEGANALLATLLADVRSAAAEAAVLASALRALAASPAAGGSDRPSCT